MTTPRKDNQRRKFERPLGERRYRKLFIIAAEGTKTEPQYFALLNNFNAVIKVSCLKSRNDSAPLQVLARMKKHLKEKGFTQSDEAWLVIDKDQWTDNQLQLLLNWSQQEDNYGFALSNPKFEYWLLLHFENNPGITGPQDCSKLLNQHCPGYDKSIRGSLFSPDRINDAIQRAKQKDTPPCDDWPKTFGSTVYRLVEKIRTA